MNPTRCVLIMNMLTSRLLKLTASGLLLGLLGGTPWTRAAEGGGQDFADPADAVRALVEAAQAKDAAALRTVFGLATDELVAADRVQATNELAAFVAAYEAEHRLARESEERCLLIVGANAWPFPIPIVRRDGRWRFDTQAGQEELLNRLIGRHELSVLKVMRVYVEAQREYASQDRDGDEVLEYAQHLASAPGTKDGLFWSPDLDGELSPLGPFVAQAQAEGYAMGARVEPQARQPFHGYYFKVLTRQGKHASGGKHGYVINGNMIAGFALVAWPARYGQSGIMTFIVNQQGRVYQKDGGPRTGTLALAMTAYDPDASWSVSPD